MKKQQDQFKSQFRPWQRITAVITTFFLLMQTSVSVLAATLTDEMIETFLTYDSQFQPAESGSNYLYEAADYVVESDPVQIVSMQSFYDFLKEEKPDYVEPPKWIPIAVGDITTFIPKYKDFKYVGTPFVQIRHVREQVNSLLGRNLIDPTRAGFETEYAQLNALYENAIRYADYAQTIKIGDQLNLTTDQVPYDMVWPELRTIDNQQVLVPILYLTPETIGERRVVGNENTFVGPASFNNISISNATVKCGRDLFLTARNDLTIADGGSIECQGDSNITVDGKLSLFSGHIKSAGDIKIQAQSVEMETVVHRYDYGYEQGGTYGEVADIVSEDGSVIVRSHSDIVMVGGQVQAGNEITFAADGSIYLMSQPIETTGTFTDRWNGTYTNVDYLQSGLTAEETIKLIANGEVVIDAAEIVSSRGHIEILAGLGITIESDLEIYQHQRTGKFGKKKIDESVYQTVAMRALLDAGKGLRLHSETGDIVLRSADITTQDGTTIKATNGGVQLLMTTETDHYSYSAVKEGTFTTTTKQKGHVIETGVANTIVGGFAVEALNGVVVEYEGLEDLECNDYLYKKNITPGANEDPCLRANILQLSEMEGMGWMADILAQADLDPESYRWDEIALEHKTWRESNTSLSPAFAAVVSIALAVAFGPAGANVGAMVTSGTGAVATAMSAGAVALASQASMAVINGAVNGDVGQALEDFASDDTLKSLAVTMITAGAIAQLDAAFFDIDTEAVEAAAESARQTATMAGATSAEIQAAVDAAVDAATLSLGMQTVQAVTHAAVRAGVQTVIEGGNFGEFGDSFAHSLLQSAIDEIGEQMATEIGQSFKVGDISNVTRYIAHAATGCMIGVASGALDQSEGDSSENCASGLGGAVVGEFIGDYQKSQLEHAEELSALESWMAERGIISEEDYYRLTDAEKEQLRINIASTGMSYREIQDFRSMTVDISKLGAGLTAFVAGVDVEIAAATAENAVENNAIQFAYLAYLWFAANATLTVIDAYDKVQGVVELSEKLDAIDQDDSLTDSQKETAKKDIILDFAKDLGVDITIDVIANATGTKALTKVLEIAKKDKKATDNVLDELEKLDDSVQGGGRYEPEIDPALDLRQSRENTDVAASDRSYARELSPDEEAFKTRFTQESFPDEKSNHTSEELQASAWAAYKETSQDPRPIVMGRLPDTEAGGELGFQYLNTNIWSPEVNDAWIQGGIDANRTFYLGSNPDISNFRADPVYDIDGNFLGRGEHPGTVFLREMKQLRDAGYRLEGHYMVPPITN